MFKNAEFGLENFEIKRSPTSNIQHLTSIERLLPASFLAVRDDATLSRHCEGGTTEAILNWQIASLHFIPFAMTEWLLYKLITLN